MAGWPAAHAGALGLDEESVRRDALSSVVVSRSPDRAAIAVFGDSSIICGDRKRRMPMKYADVALDLEVTEVEIRMRHGCQNSSSTNPRCTCPPPIDPQGPN
jgi:hypothetical protein